MLIVQSSLHIMELTRLWKTFIVADIHNRSYNLKYAKNNRKRLTLFSEKCNLFISKFLLYFCQKISSFFLMVEFKIDLHNFFSVAYKWCLQSILCPSKYACMFFRLSTGHFVDSNSLFSNFIHWKTCFPISSISYSFGPYGFKASAMNVFISFLIFSFKFVVIANVISQYNIVRFCFHSLCHKTDCFPD